MAQNAGFVNVVNVVHTYGFQKCAQNRVLLMLLMLLIFFGSYVEESEHSPNRSEKDFQH